MSQHLVFLKLKAGNFGVIFQMGVFGSQRWPESLGSDHSRPDYQQTLQYRRAAKTNPYDDIPDIEPQ
ncbi:MAG: hypothetical protein R3C61_04235 [Bacteroidia bacterium]